MPKSLPRSAVALALLLLAGVFYRASSAPVWHLDTWGHWKYGRWICEHGRLPRREPFSAYSERGPLLDTWWLSQVICYRVYAAGGLEGIALFYGLLEVATTALYLLAFRRASGSLPLAVVGIVLMEAGRWTFFGVLRPQALGELCWAALLVFAATLMRREDEGRQAPGPRWGLVVVPACMIPWANLHGAFLLGLLLIGLFLAGRVIAAGLRDRQVWFLALTLVLALAACCVNPYGPGYLPRVIRFGRTPSLQFVGEWQPMRPLTTYGSWAMALSVIAVLATARWSPRRFRFAEVGLLLFFGPGAWFAQRMVPFWMTVWPLVLLPHWRALLTRGGAERPVDAGRGRWLTGAAAAAGAVALVLLSPSGRWLLAGRPRPAAERVRPETPLAVARDLRGGPPARVFSSVVWSDYLLWELPPGDQLYWYSHWHCFSQGHMIVGERLLKRRGPPDGWRSILDRYRFNVVALRNEERSRPLFDYLLAQHDRPGGEWDVTLYPDPAGGPPAGLVARRRIDPFVLGLLGAQAAQGCVGGGGPAPLAGNWAVLTHLPWSWSAR